LKSKTKDPSYDRLREILDKRGQRILDRFGCVISLGVENSELSTILKEVKSYWRDVFRPVLTSLSCEAVGGQPETADDAGVMFSLAGAGFGIHDDIIDKSSRKKLRMTIPGLFGVDKALLVGDLLITKAWTMIREIIIKNCNPKEVADIIELYSNFSVEVCEAELMEVLCRRKLDTDIEYYKGILWKAMAETEACTKIGAILGGGKDKERQALGEFGRRLGFICRLMDDVKDCLNIEGNLLHRIEYESVPLPLLHAAKNSKKNYQKIREIWKKKPISLADSAILLDSCFEARSFDYVLSLAKYNQIQALRRLRVLEPSNAREALRIITRTTYCKLANLCS